MASPTRLTSNVFFALAAAAWIAGIPPLRCHAQSSTATTPAAKAEVPNPRAADFKSRDANADGFLTENEYVAGGGPEKQRVRREFLVFDCDGDGRMSLVEFLTVPAGQPDDQRGVIADPVIRLSDAKLVELTMILKKFDRNGDDLLDSTEFAVAAIGSRIAGLETTTFEVWDMNGDKQLSREEIARVLNIAFGVCIHTGEPLRSNTGRVVDWALFRDLQKDAKGMVSQEEYFRAVGPGLKDRESWMAAIDKNHDGQFDYVEFAQGNHRTDPVATFLSLDVDLNGRLELAELDALPEGWRQMARHSFMGFDDDRDHAISLREYQLMPHCNILAQWQAAVDTDNDGVLSPGEFRFIPGIPLAALTAEYFRRLDANGDKTLSLDEWPFSTTHASSKFRLLDKDLNGLLTESEFTAEGSLPVNRLSRDFKIFDADQNGQMNLSEFMTIPYWIAERQRRSPADPVIRLSEAAIKELTDRWETSDKDGDRGLSSKEFADAGIGRLIPGVEDVAFATWDRNHDGTLTRDEAKLLVEIAFGVRTPQGGLLRLNSGFVVDWRLFMQLKTDREGFVSREEYFRGLGPLADSEKEKWLAMTDKDHDGKFNYDEFALSNHRTDPLATFLILDTDLNGKLTKDELQALSADQVQIADHVFPGFDDDRDGALSLDEYRLTPFVNLLASWQHAQDKNNDGKLIQSEFRFAQGAPLAALSAEYFRRLDVNQDQSLSLEEFPFTTTHASAVETELHAEFADGSSLMITVPDYETIFSPRVSPDGKWVAFDGWKYGRSHLTAHLLIASLETDEIRDLGLGCLPAWSADGRRLAFCKHGQGVFIRDFEGKGGNEESIAANGFGIQFSPDGRTVAYIERGNFVIHNVKTKSKDYVFPVGKSPYHHIEHNFAWSPDSKRICFLGHRPVGTIDVGIVVAEAGGDDPKLRVRLDGNGIQSDFAWRPDGRRVMFSKLAANGERSQLYELDPDEEKPPVRYAKQPKNRNNLGPCWSSDGKTFVFLAQK